MSINLTVTFSHPKAVATRCSYARLDNLAPGQAPIFTTVPNLVGASGTFTIAEDVPNGQYQINGVPIYADNRICPPTIVYTSACPGLTSISGSLQGNILVVSYLAPSTVTNILITVNYPNGGSFQNVYVNTGNPISIGLPFGVYGTYSFFGQSVCDPTSDFYSPPSSTVSLIYANSVGGSYFLGNNIGQVCAASVTTLYTSGVPVPGTTILYLDQGLQNALTGYSLVMYQGVVYNVNPTTGALGTDSGLNCNPTVIARNALSFLNISQITGIPGFTYTPATGAFYQTGTHGTFTGAIAAVFSGTVPGSPSFSINLYKNGQLIDCIPYNPGTYVNQTLTFGVFTFAATDSITVDSGTGGCS